MQRIRSYRQSLLSVVIGAAFSLTVFAPAASAMPANVEAELSALNISESEFETELGIETLYNKLESIAHRLCQSGLYQALQPRAANPSNCVPDMVQAFVNAIGHDRLLAYHHRRSPSAFT